MQQILPPGLTAAEFDEALEALRAIVGADWVFTGETMAGYRDPYPIVSDGRFEAAAAVAPADVEQVQRIVRVAAAVGLPLWPISCGRNIAYGGPAPRVAGSIVLDLKRMNRILEVNEEFGYALVEPGVSYFDLYEYIQARGLKLWLDTPDPGWGSVLGNTLERGVGYTPYGDHFMMQCGMEVVLADGEVLRTGMGALPGNNTWQLFKYGFGPYLDGLFTQSNYGVVTKLGIWLMPEPPGYRPYMISVPREEDIEQMVEILRPLKVNMVVQNAATIRNSLIVAALNSTRSQYYTGDGPMPDSARRKLMADHDIGEWNFYGALYGPPPIMDAHLSIIRDAFAAMPSAKFYFSEDRPAKTDVLHHRGTTMKGVPNMTEFGFVNWIDGGGHIDFSPVSPTTGKDALKQYEMVRDRANGAGYDYLGIFIIGWREMHHVFTLIYDRTNSDTRQSAHALFEQLVQDAAAAGYGEYRTHLEFMDQVAGTYSWNDNALLRFNQKLKDALDPKGILAPGKQGIWPAHLRGDKS